MTPAEFEERAGRLGISNDTPIVVYDDNASLHAARAWWVFDHFGHGDVRIVDGGFNAWLHEGRPLTSQVPRPERASFTARVDDARLCLVDELKSIAEAGGVQIWDARSDGEWTGENDRGNERAGHVPGATHLEWMTLMEGPPSWRFRRSRRSAPPSSRQASIRKRRPSPTDRVAFGPRSRSSSCVCSVTTGLATTTARWASGQTARTRHSFASRDADAQSARSCSSRATRAIVSSARASIGGFTRPLRTSRK